MTKLRALALSALLATCVAAGSTAAFSGDHVAAKTTITKTGDGGCC